MSWHNEPYRHSLAARGIPSKITVYHGTDISSARKILEEGVKEPDRNQIKMDLLEKYNLNDDDVPDWVWEKGRYLDYKGRERFSATPSIEMARGYSTHPNEMENTMEHNLQVYLGIKESVYGASDLKYDKSPAVLECELSNPKKHKWFFPGSSPDDFEEIYEDMIRYNNDYVEVEVSDLNDIKCKKIINDMYHDKRIR